MTFLDFLNAANKIRFLDHDQVPFLSADEWPRFRDDPVRFTLSPKNRDHGARIWEAANYVAPVSVRKIVPGEPASDTVDVL